MILAFVSFFIYCALLVGWIIMLAFVRYVEKKDPETCYSSEKNHFRLGYLLLYIMLAIAMYGNFNKNIRVTMLILTISVLNFAIYLAFLITKKFTQSEKTKKDMLPKWKKARSVLMFLYSVSLFVSIVICFIMNEVATK